MKNKLSKNIVFGIACTLGLGSVISNGVLIGQKQENLIESKAAITSESFYVGGIDIIEDQDHHVELGDGYAEFDTETNTLTLHNCTYTGEGTYWRDYYYQSDYYDYRAAIMLKKFREDITIVLEGENTFTCTATEDFADGFVLFSDYNHKATIKGENGSLTVSGRRYGFYCKDAGLIFESGTLNAISTGATSGTLNESAGYCIYTAAGDEDTGYLHQYKKDVVINATGGTLPSDVSYGGTYGILCVSVFNWYIDGATINAVAGNVNNNGLDSIGLQCSNNDITIRNNTRLIAKGGEGTTKSYGVESVSSTVPLIVENNIKYLEFAGHTSALANGSRLRNSIIGLYASEFDGSGTLSTLATNTTKKGQAITTGNQNLKFQRITADVVSFEGDYDGSEHSISITNLDPADSTVEYSIDDGGTWSTTLPTFVNAGKYSINYRFSKEYFPTVSGTANVTINEIDLPEVSVAVTGETIAYDGEPHSPTIVTSPSSAGGTDITFTYSATETGEFTTEIPEFIDAGTHTIYWKATCPNYKEVSGSVEFTITYTPTSGTNGELPGWAIALIAIGGVLVLGCLLLVALFLFNPRYVVDNTNKKVIRTILVKEHDDLVLLLDTHLRKVRCNKVDVYKTRAEAEKALNK